MSMLDIWLGILQGFRITASVTLYGLLFAIPFGLVFGVAQYLTSGLARLVVTSVIEFWRSSAVIILLFVFYYALPVVGVTLPAMTVGAMVLGLNVGGYASQAVRAGLQALDRGQKEAGQALGLSRPTILLLIELPQALVAMSPTFINLVIQLVKATSLVSLITLTDMTFRAKEISQIEYEPVPILSVAAAGLFCCLLSDRAVRALGGTARKPGKGGAPWGLTSALLCRPYPPSSAPSA